MNPSFDKGRARSSWRVSSFAWSVSRIRKECVCEPWSNWGESGNDENALQIPIKLGKSEHKSLYIHVLSLCMGQGQRGEDGYHGGAEFQIKIH